MMVRLEIERIMRREKEPGKTLADLKENQDRT
jgi:hypothetical protein